MSVTLKASQMRGHGLECLSPKCPLLCQIVTRMISPHEMIHYRTSLLNINHKRYIWSNSTRGLDTQANVWTCKIHNWVS